VDHLLSSQLALINVHRVQVLTTNLLIVFPDFSRVIPSALVQRLPVYEWAHVFCVENIIEIVERT
jgi:hypothetical protein